ncbi:MAG: hydroxyphenylacetyl-CoA thioesterase PaaI [Rhodocyclaceae bacterium]|nr:hydroxyphenylacetyl-CoA thioesterase PaaI [Rhodocyclaceae bacterium]
MPAHPSQADALVLARKVASAMEKQDAAVRHMGIRIEDVAPGLARVRMELKPEMLNSHGTGHGGFIFALADTAFAYSCNAGNEANVAAGCSIEYLVPAACGDVLTAVAKERHRSGRTGIYDVTVSNQRNEIIAVFRGKSHRIKGTSVPEGSF